MEYGRIDDVIIQMDTGAKGINTTCRQCLVKNHNACLVFVYLDEGAFWCQCRENYHQ